MKGLVLAVALSFSSSSMAIENQQIMISDLHNQALMAKKHAGMQVQEPAIGDGIQRIVKSLRGLYTLSGSSYDNSYVCDRLTKTGCVLSTTLPNQYGSYPSNTIKPAACDYCFSTALTQCYTCPSGSALYTPSSWTSTCICTTLTNCAFSYCVAAADYAAAVTAGYSPVAPGTVGPPSQPVSTCNMYGTAYPLTPGQGPCAPSTAASCFSGSDAVTLEGGTAKALSEVVVGDRVLTADSKGVLSFADVVFLPHGANTQEATFVEITTARKQLKATPMHLMQTCSGALVYAGSLKTGDCLRTVDGDEAIASASKITASGLYTAVTTNEFLVVNGVVASPFAVSHGVTHAFYNIHRALYKIAPAMMKSSAVVTANGFLASTAVLASNFFSTSK